MGKIVVTEFVSLDGVMEDPGGAEDFKYGGWTFEIERGDEGNKFKVDETMNSEALLLGRKTYEGFAEAWPQRDGEFADRFNNMPKYVVSSTLKDPDWTNTTVLDGDLAESVGKLRDELDGDIVVHGSAQLVQGLIDDGLVDELRLMVFPVVLGSGKRLFGETSDKQLAAADRLEDRRRRRADPDLRAGGGRLSGRARQPALEGELGDRLGQLLRRVRHRRVPDAADVAELRAGDQPLEAAALAGQQDHVERAPQDQHGHVERRQPAWLGVMTCGSVASKPGLLANSSRLLGQELRVLPPRAHVRGPGGEDAADRALAEERRRRGVSRHPAHAAEDGRRPRPPPGRAGARRARSP